jgi:DNA invertase Pin-like site-specific DNA recombinase
MKKKEKVIKNVAIYLRKSRGDVDKDILSKHRLALTEFANKKEYNYTYYTEGVKSGETLDTRPKMLELLEDIKLKKYDGVLVMEYERLSRGDSLDFGTILRVLQFADCQIVTPDRVYRVNNPQDITMLGIVSVFANTELRNINRRLNVGKQIGAKEGRWVNGKPPYPYVYKKRVIVNEKGNEEVIAEVKVDIPKNKVYQEIKQKYISGNYGTESIAIDLNQRGIKSPYGKQWCATSVKRLLLQEFHMGYSIYGRWEWKKDLETYKQRATRLRDKDEWCIGKGDWEILKTEQEHQAILREIKKKTRTPSRAKQGVFATSGLMYCKKCGYTMQYQHGRTEKSGKQYNYTKCLYVDSLGNKCSQRGLKLSEDFYEALYNTVITSYLNKDIISREQANKLNVGKMQEEIADIQKMLDKQEEVLTRINEAYLEGVYSLKDFGEEKKKLDSKTKEYKSRIKELEKGIEMATSFSKAELDSKIDNFKNLWRDDLTDTEKNRLLKSVVKKITYNRESHNVELEIEYF